MDKVNVNSKALPNLRQGSYRNARITTPDNPQGMTPEEIDRANKRDAAWNPYLRKWAEEEHQKANPGAPPLRFVDVYLGINKPPEY